MESAEWLIGWKKIGKYLGKSAKTAQRYAKKAGLPFFRDPGGHPMAKPSMIDEFILGLNREQYNDKIWKDKGIEIALDNEYYKEQERKEFDERFLLAQRRPRSQF